MSKRLVQVHFRIPTKKRRLDKITFQIVPISDGTPNPDPNIEPVIDEVIPKADSVVPRRLLKKAGPFILGPKLTHSPTVNCLMQCLARKENTKEFYQLKMVVLNKRIRDEDERLGKMLLYAEYSLLSVLHNEEGVVKQHGIFTDYAFEENITDDVKLYTGEVKKRIILVLDCVTPHDYCEKSTELVNLQRYLKEGKIAEVEIIQIFYEVVKIIERLHRKNIIHRDLKPVNMILNRRTRKITIANFSLGKELINENELIIEKIGTPAYISPDVLTSQSYKGKPPDMWTLGIVLYTMCYEKFPFFDSNTNLLLKKIKTGDYSIPSDVKVSADTQNLIRGLLLLCPDERLTATEVLNKLESMITSKVNIRNELDQRVPQCQKDEKREKYKHKFRDAPSLKPFECNRLSFSQLLELASTSSSQSSFPNMVTSDYLIPAKSFDPRLFPNHEMRQQSSSNLFDRTQRHNQWPNSNNSLAINQQMSNLTIRNQQELRRNLSWHDVRNYSSVTRNADISNTVRRFTACRLPVVPYSTARPNRMEPTRHHLIQNLINTFNETFIQGRVPLINRDDIREFDGIITQDLGQKITDWLRTEFMTNSIIRLIFGNGNDNEDEKVLELLRLLGVQIETIDGVTKIKREQTVDLLMIITYMLQAAGYNNTYFIC